MVESLMSPHHRVSSIQGAARGPTHSSAKDRCTPGPDGQRCPFQSSPSGTPSGEKRTSKRSIPDLCMNYLRQRLFVFVSNISDEWLDQFNEPFSKYSSPFIRTVLIQQRSSLLVQVDSVRAVELSQVMAVESLTLLSWYSWLQLHHKD